MPREARRNFSDREFWKYGKFWKFYHSSHSEQSRCGRKTHFQIRTPLLVLSAPENIIFEGSGHVAKLFMALCFEGEGALKIQAKFWEEPTRWAFPSRNKGCEN